MQRFAFLYEDNSKGSYATDLTLPGARGRVDSVVIMSDSLGAPISGRIGKRV